MGNCLALCKTGAMEKHVKVVRVAKPDGKILEFSSFPIHVKDILKNFPDATGIGVSKIAAEPLSQDHELKIGRLYYLLPPPCSPSNLTSIGNNKEPGSGIKRIKVVITKQQLQQLVTKQISVEDLLLSQVQTVTVNLPTDRKPRLDSIPEEYE